MFAAVLALPLLTILVIQWQNSIFSQRMTVKNGPQIVFAISFQQKTFGCQKKWTWSIRTFHNFSQQTRFIGRVLRSKRASKLKKSCEGDKYGMRRKNKHQGCKTLGAKNLDNEAKLCFVNIRDKEDFSMTAIRKKIDVRVTYTKTKRNQQISQIKIALHSKTDPVD